MFNLKSTQWHSRRRVFILLFFSQPSQSDAESWTRQHQTFSTRARLFDLGCRVLAGSCGGVSEPDSLEIDGWDFSNCAGQHEQWSEAPRRGGRTHSCTCVVSVLKATSPPRHQRCFMVLSTWRLPSKHHLGSHPWLKRATASRKTEIYFFSWFYLLSFSSAIISSPSLSAIFRQNKHLEMAGR